MSPVSVPAQAALRWLCRYPYSLACVVIGAVLLVSFCTRQLSEWDGVYLTAAQRLLNGDDLYLERSGYCYPPLLAALAVPFTFLPGLLNRLAWFVVNAVCLVYLVRAAWRLSGGGVLQGPQSNDRREHLVCLLGLGCSLWYCLNALSHQQTDLLIAALVLAGCVAIQHERWLRAGALFGLAAAMKCTPLLWLPYLLLRRRWAAALWLACVAVGVNFLPDLIHPAPENGTWLGRWHTVYLKRIVTGAIRPGEWASDVTYNQSLAGALHRWQTTRWTWTAAGVVVERTPASDPAVSRWGLYAGAGLLLLLTACAIGWRARREDEKREGPPRLALEAGLVLTLMLLLSPMSSPAHFCILVLPALCVARLAVMQRSTVYRVLMGLALALALLRKDLAGTNLHTLGLWYGVAMWNAVLLGGGLVTRLWAGAIRGQDDPDPVAPSQSKILCVHHLAAGPRDERGEDREADRFADELHVPIAEHDVAAASVE